MLDIEKNIMKWIEARQLVRLSSSEKKSNLEYLHGRILQYDQNDQKILFYHDDEKKVYNFHLNEIKAIEAGQDNVQVDPKKEILTTIAEKNANRESKRSKVETPKPSVQPATNKVESEALKEIIQLLSDFPEDTLKALLPLVRHMKETRRNQ